MTAGSGLTVVYASYNKPTSIIRGTTTIGFSHEPEHQRPRLRPAARQFGTADPASAKSSRPGSAPWCYELND
jgi:hypothetical protein